MYRFEEALKNINKEFIRLSEEERRLHHEIIKALLYFLTERMKKIDGLFAKMYVRTFYGGSYYDGLKITKPDEYDLDLLLKIPDICEPDIGLDTTYPGHVTIKLNTDRIFKQPEGPSYNMALSKNKYRSQERKKGSESLEKYNKKKTKAASSIMALSKNKYRSQERKKGSESLEKYNKKKTKAASSMKLSSFLDRENYLNASKVRSWMESLITRTLNEYHGNMIDLKLPSGNVTLQVTMKKSGPANTFQVKGMVNSIKVEIDIDFVPCFVFRRCRYPIDVRRFRDDLRQDYFIVPKTPKDEDRLWRLSFQEQERVLINGKDRLKPALKLLKRLRDNLGHDVIASYYLKTLFLWKCEEVNDSFWLNNSLSTVFMTMLEYYQDHLQRREIKYYWDHNLNLLGNLKLDALANITGRISRIIADIKTKNNDAVIYEYLGKGKKRNLFPEETSSFDTSSFPTWAKIAIGGIAVAGLAAVVTAAGESHSRREEERRRRQGQNEHQNNEEDRNCLLM